MAEKKKKKHGCLIAVIVVVVLVVIVAALGGGSDEGGNNVTVTDSGSAAQTTTTSEQTPNEDTSTESTESEETQLEKYTDGMYKVGADIPAGEYILDPTSTGYYQVASDSTGTLDSIVSNDNFSGTRYITVSDGQYLTLTRCTAYPASYVSDGKIKNDNLTDGMYKVGVDIEAGEYKVTPNGDGYYEVDSSSVGTLDAIVANENFTSDVYITVSDGQYLKLSRATLVK